jgi:hypothetical protein
MTTADGLRALDDACGSVLAAYANRLILRTLSAQLGLPTVDVTPAALASGLATVPGDRVRAAARAVLEADTAALPERAEAPATSG